MKKVELLLSLMVNSMEIGKSAKTVAEVIDENIEHSPEKIEQKIEQIFKRKNTKEQIVEISKALQKQTDQRIVFSIFFIYRVYF